MPELPEVENVRRTLERHLVGRTVQRVTLHRTDVVTGGRSPVSLLEGRRIVALVRHGKQLALVSEGPCVCVHLGMSGSLRVVPIGRAVRGRAVAGQTHERETGQVDPLAGCVSASAGGPGDHVHAVWQLDDGGTLLFRDPRRFGGLWTFASEHALRGTRWASLGDDALQVGPTTLHRRLRATRRSLKAALLDQGLVAGLGNIYVDELLFTARLSPLRPADTLSRAEAASLVRHMRTLLGRAIAAGGTTLRDYVDGNGDAGGFQQRHRVYGRAGQRCRRRGCQSVVHTGVIAGRTTAWCPRCQPETSLPRRELSYE